MKDPWIPASSRLPKDSAEHPTVASGPVTLNQPARLLCWHSSNGARRGAGDRRGAGREGMKVETHIVEASEIYEGDWLKIETRLEVVRSVEKYPTDGYEYANLRIIRVDSGDFFLPRNAKMLVYREAKG